MALYIPNAAVRKLRILYIRRQRARQRGSTDGTEGKIPVIIFG
jgi:hypothetical protein